MSARRITVSSRAMGTRDSVTVLVYDTPEQMRRAATRYNGVAHPDDEGALGFTQLAYRANDDRAITVTVRLERSHLNTQIVSHEMHHASTAWYGAHVSDRISRRHHLNHHNEPFAHLFSDLLTKLVDRLYELGYYA